MFCTNCGRQIADDSSFCPYCGKTTLFKETMYCPRCGKTLKDDSLFCSFCGTRITSTKENNALSYSIPQFNIKRVFRSRFFYVYISWIFVNCILLYKAQDAYSNYFNGTNISPDYWLSSDKGIYPEDWLYPFFNIFKGIMGQDPVYVYDLSEFLLYSIIIPVLLTVCIYKRTKIFNIERASNTFYWTTWYVSIWMLVVFLMGLFGLDYLGWSFMMGGLIIGIYSYKKTFAKLYGK